jgi:flagellar biogenesis protein FliO
VIALVSSALALAAAQAAALPPPPAASGPAWPAGAALAGPVGVLLLLAAAALLLTRRRRAPARRIQVLETTALGPRRSLVLARLGDELLLIGASDAGITLLRSQSSPREARAVAPVPVHAAAALPPAAEPTASLVDLAARMLPARRRGPGARPSPAFAALLAESDEDQELRRKLAAGRSGSVR